MRGSFQNVSESCSEVKVEGVTNDNFTKLNDLKCIVFEVRRLTGKTIFSLSSCNVGMNLWRKSMIRATR